MTALKELYGASTHLDLVRWIRTEYGIGAKVENNPHRLRREEIARRVRLYRDDARADFEAIIRQVFEDARVQQQRIRLIDVATEQNVTRRIVDEVASLYDKPAVRTLPDAGTNAQFHEIEKRINLHEIMQESSRLLQLCNDVLIWQFNGVDNKSRLRIVTPDVFDALPDPRDRAVMAGVLLDVCPMSITPNRDRLPHWELWDDTYRYLLSAAGDIVDERGDPSGPIEHGLGRIPAVLLHKREPTERLLDSRPGRDITSAHLGCGLLNVMIMRLSKAQGERQPILQGNLANVAKNQSMDGESPIALPPEVQASMLDSKTDPDHYIRVKREKLASVAQTYGMSYEQLSYTESSETQSGKAYQVRREKLTELRSEQRRRALINEAQIVELLGFDPTGMKVDHQEQALPQDAAEEIDLLDKKVRMGLDSPISYLMRKDPDLDRMGALIEMKQNLTDWSLLIEMVRRMNMAKDADAKQPGQDPQQNGGGKADEAQAANDATEPAEDEPGDGA